MKVFRIFVLAVLSFTVVATKAQKVPNSQKRWAWIGFERPMGLNPIISPDSSSHFYCPMTKAVIPWENSDTFNPAATCFNGGIALLYRAEDNIAQGIGTRTSRIGYAFSEDGLHFERHGAPVLYPADDKWATIDVPGGCEDPRVCMTDDGLYVMTYTSWNHKTACLCIATSRDLIHWTKHGYAFQDFYGNQTSKGFSKSGSIVTEVIDGHQVIAKINGKYMMYWGENFVNIATSSDLIHWYPMLDKNGNLLHVMDTRKGYFDSSLVECGPPAIKTKHGIMLFYNGKNSGGQDRDTCYTANAYCAGQALFSLKDPTKLLDRLDQPFFIPEADFEKSGQYPAGTVFIEGLVPFKGKWYLYYGCADSHVSVAVYNPKRKETLTHAELMDKIKGGWAGQTIGCAYGGPTEFCYRGVIIPKSITIEYPEHHLQNFFDRSPGLFDDIYMDLTFLDVFNRLGLDAPTDSFATAFAYAPYPLWHANQAGRYNIQHGLMPPASGFWKNNPHADCIDYQIEADYAGLMSPGMPNTASAISDRIGHIMNYGDGWYGGVFVGAMYSIAFVESDIETIIMMALRTIPKRSKFYQCISRVLQWYHEDPNDWHRTWQLYNDTFAEDVGCPELILAPGNIDATMNSAYVVMGLLFGHGDFGRTLEIATRCGQDSDCNPSTAGGILATVLGYSHIPEQWMPNLREVEKRPFAYTAMSLQDTYDVCYRLALQQIKRYGGSITEDGVCIRQQKPHAVRLEQGFGGLHPEILAENIQYLGTDNGTQNTFKFIGKGIVAYGYVECNDPNYEAELEVSIDGKVQRVMNLPATFLRRTADCLYWNYDLAMGDHTVTFRLLNPAPQVNIKALRIIRY